MSGIGSSGSTWLAWCPLPTDLLHFLSLFGERLCTQSLRYCALLKCINYSFGNQRSFLGHSEVLAQLLRSRLHPFVLWLEGVEPSRTLDAHVVLSIKPISNPTLNHFEAGLHHFGPLSTTAACKKQHQRTVSAALVQRFVGNLAYVLHLSWFRCTVSCQWQRKVQAQTASINSDSALWISMDSHPNKTGSQHMYPANTLSFLEALPQRPFY
uniref:Uncharacterized protein n=1 Tax=Eutreptiella gymnastica TaxID=73025 RepID=A0A7S4G2L9_9EUGL|mmetsp:Transcript_67202/g.112760  ORF Transcript_67202/g.112760 Transcript_67202/m.112760 type:complete len:211 (+) Transcript_67202:219-851(+)